MKLPKYYLEKPKYTESQKRKFKKNIEKIFFNDRESIENVYKIGFSSKQKYLYWDEIKHIFKDAKIPVEDIWLYIKTVRKIKSKMTPIKAVNGKYFSYNELPGMNEFLHKIDLKLGGKLSLSFGLEEKEKKRIFLDSLSEEGIASAELEGAHTTRDIAQKLIKENRKPRDKNERMILNNYKAMMLLEREFLGQSDKKIDEKTFFNFHKILTHDVIENDNFDAVGRLRKKDEKIDVADDKYIYHEVPNVSFVKKELPRLIDFINDDLKHDFIHPVLKAIMIHFWIGYLHPFYDGNGRMARLMFYLYLLKHNYYFFGYFPISIVLKKSNKKYGMSYVYSEQDDEDLTYFLDFNIEVIKKSEENFYKYIKKVKEKKEKNNEKYKKMEVKNGLNERQIYLLEYLNKSAANSMTLKVYMDNNKISRATANKDLKKIFSLGFVEKKKVGREQKYYITKKGQKLFE